MVEKNKFPHDYDGSACGIDLNSTAVQKMADAGPTHDTLQETIYGWLRGTTLYAMSDLDHLTYADFVEHIGCDAQEYRFKSLGRERVYTWIATDSPLSKFSAFFRENENGKWTISFTGSVQVRTPEEYIDKFKKQ